MVTLKGVVEGACEEDLRSDARIRARAFFGPEVAPCITIWLADAEDIGTRFRATYEARVEHDWPRDEGDHPCRNCRTY